jgi:hypothetical protein
MHRKKSHHKESHLFYKIAGLLLIAISLVLAFYYYMNSPIYQPKSGDAEPTVRGASTSDQIIVETIPKSDTLTIRIPDGVNVTLEDAVGRKSGYTAQSKGFLNDIPFSEVVLGSDGTKSMVVSESLAPKYMLEVSGSARQEALLIEIDNATTGVQSELIPLNALGKGGAEYVLTISPLLIESSNSLHVQ